jgi:hypothetical protein
MSGTAILLILCFLDEALERSVQKSGWNLDNPLKTINYRTS